MAKKKKQTKRKKADQKMFDQLDAKFADELGEIQTFGNERIEQVNVADADLDYVEIFGANKNLYRTIASMTDGLKPGARRLFYSWWELEHKPTNTDRSTLNKLKFIKVDKLSANTVNYHPHGTSATDELIGRLGQYWNNNVMCIVPQGSYGNMAGDIPAAGRYREAKMSEFMIDCFFDGFDKYCVPMKLGYDGENYEPETLPSKYPYVLFNPQFSGIGYGLASNIPPFNVSEVLDATIKLIQDSDAKIMLVPDSPTGCDILDEGNFKEINKSGQSKLTMRASVEIDYVDNVIKITSLPINSNSTSVIGKLVEFKVKKEADFDDIVEIKDYTKEGEVLIEIYLRKEAKPDKVVRKFFKKNTGLKSTFPVGITVIDDYAEYEYGVKELLLQWISYRQDMVRSMFLNNLQVLISKQHMNKVLLMVFSKDNIDTTVKIAKESKSRKETIDKLMKKFKITSVQAGTIADMHVYNFNKDSYDRYLEESKTLEEEIDKVNEILSNDEKIDEFIIDQLKEGKKKWGRPRMSKIIKENDKNNEDIPDTEHLVGISETGFAKKISRKGSSGIGPVGKTNSNLTVVDVNNRENLLVIDSTGQVVKVPISAIPNMDVEDIGIELKRFFSVKGSIKAVMELPSMNILSVKDESLNVVFITKKGFAKKVQLSEFDKITDTKPGIILNKDDEVAAALFAFDNTEKDIIISTNIGNGIHLSMDDIKTATCTAKGVNVVTLQDGEEIVSASLVNPKKKLMFLMTTSGRAKVIETKYFPVMKRKDKTVNLIGLVGNETLLGISSVNKTDVVMAYHKNTEPDSFSIKDMEIGTRVSKGNRIVKTGRGDSIVGYKVFRN